MAPPTGRIPRLFDALIEAPVVTSYTRIGPAVRSRLARWRPLDDYRLDGKVVLVTGATSGLGLAAAEQLAQCGATVVLLGRDAEKLERVRSDLAATTGSVALETIVADMADLAAVRAAAAAFTSRHDRLDALIHNAGALSAERRITADGLESTVACHVVGPFLLTRLLLDPLRAAAPGRVVTVSSGGMYTAGLTVDRLQMGDDYRGAEQYARAKRVQVTLTEMWADRIPADEVVFHSMHPGWADTPGVRASLPRFRAVVGPLLRTPAEGADTAVWLVADRAAIETDGRFWLDRAPRPIHRLGSTRRTDTAERRAALWAWVEAAAG